jgi:hypothetical protein
MLVTVDKLIKANQYGLEGGEASYYTPVLEIAARIGNIGIDLSRQPIVSGRRYGKAPETYISHNYRDDSSERGLSLMALDGHKDHWSIMTMSDRPVFNYTGILLPYTGSDDEPLILCLDAEDLDC